MIPKRLLFLKLGGSVITDKDTTDSADFVTIDRIAAEIHQAQLDDPGLSLVIGHGSGSFGHHAASKYGTRNGVVSKNDWAGFCEVGERARALNQIVVEHLIKAGINVVSISPCSSILAKKRQIQSWDISSIQHALSQNLAPVIYGDVIFDSALGGTILSTEELFAWLALNLKPRQILLAGIEPGVWQDFPQCTTLLSEIDPCHMEDSSSGILGSKSVDVTGGMASKVKSMAAIIKEIPSLEVQLFSGAQPGNVYATLMGHQKGTWIRYSKG